MHQHINMSTPQHVYTSTHQHINTSTHQHINTSTHQHINYQLDVLMCWCVYLLMCWYVDVLMCSCVLINTSSTSQSGFVFVLIRWCAVQTPACRYACVDVYGLLAVITYPKVHWSASKLAALICSDNQLIIVSVAKKFSLSFRRSQIIRLFW